MSVSATVGDIWTEFVATRCSALRDELIMTYTPLVRLVVGKLGIPPTTLLEADDLISYGTIGLINAIDRFDPTRGVPFEAFATARIRGAVIDQLRALNWLPRSALTRLRQIESALSTLEQFLGRPALEEEAAAAIGVSTVRYRQMRREVDITILSLDAPPGLLPHLDGVASLGDLLEDHDLLGPAEVVEQRELLALLRSAISQLPARESLLLSLYYQQELTMKEISRVVGVSESRVCQLHIQAVSRLRTMLNIYQGTKNLCVLVDRSKRSRQKIRSV